MDISIIIVNYNTTELTQQCIQSIKTWTRQQSYEIIVVDNASPDQSIRQLPLVFPEVKLILNKENAGFGRANNLGIAQAQGDYVFLINSDTYLLNDAISIFWNYMEAPQNAQVGSCGAALFYPDGQPQMSFGNFPSLLEAFSNLGFYLLYKDYFKKHICSGVVNYSEADKVVDYVTGADLFIRKSVLTQVGAFDPDFFMYFEETELAFRMKKAGFCAVLLPKAHIVHIEGGSQAKGMYFNLSKIKLYASSRHLFFKKCYGSFTAFLIKMLYVFRSFVMFCLKRKRGYLQTAKIIYRT